MTKRFTTKNIICSNYCVWDNDDKPYGNDEIVDLLNTQHETIQDQKRQLDELDGLLNKFEVTFEELEDILYMNRSRS